MSDATDRWTDSRPSAERLSLVVLDCIASAGVEKATMNELAARMDYSRAGFFKSHLRRSLIFSQVHEQIVQTLDLRCRFTLSTGSRRADFEYIWSELLDFLCSTRGAAFLCLRAAVLSGEDASAALHREQSQLQHLTAWVGSASADAPSRAQAFWCLLLVAARHPQASPAQHATRELVWELVGAQQLPTDALDIDAAVNVQPVTLSELLTTTCVRTPAAPTPP